MLVLHMAEHSDTKKHVEEKRSALLFSSLLFSVQASVPTSLPPLVLRPCLHVDTGITTWLVATSYTVVA